MIGRSVFSSKSTRTKEDHFTRSNATTISRRVNQKTTHLPSAILDIYNIITIELRSTQNVFTRTSPSAQLAVCDTTTLVPEKRHSQ
jgi:hypothetical protein